METVITLVPLPDAALTDLKDALAQAALPHADVKEEGRQFFAGQCRGQSVGFIGFEVYGGEALLRSLVVREADRGKGFGSALVQVAIDAAAAQGATRVWVLTTDGSRVAATPRISSGGQRCGATRDQGDDRVRFVVPGDCGLHDADRGVSRETDAALLDATT